VYKRSPVNRRNLLLSALAAGVAPRLARDGVDAPGVDTPVQGGPGGRARIRNIGLSLGRLPVGPLNAITDVTGVAVGHATLLSGEPPLVVGKGPVRTGVTIVRPRPAGDTRPCRAGVAVLNGNGEMTGVLPIRRTGLLASPVCLTGTANIGIVHQALMEILLESDSHVGPALPAPIVAECWDSLGDIRGRHLRAAHVREAFAAAKSGPIAEGAVGGGTGMISYEFKGGIGTSSRALAGRLGGHTVGILINANHGLREQLLVGGIPVGRELGDVASPRRQPSSSIVLVAATDAPLDARQLERLALRLALGLARTGATANTSSGDLMLAFSTAAPEGPVLFDERVTPLYEAAVEAAEEAVLNALTMAVDVVGADGKLCPALPLDRLREILRRHGRLP
jgi:D-aminopeptidase